MIRKQLYSAKGNEWHVLGRDDKKAKKVIDTNEYVVTCGKEVLMIDPGGTEIFPQVVSAVSELVKIAHVNTFFCSHQDPDIMSSLMLWLGLRPQAKIYLPWIWSTFVAHFGYDYVNNFVHIPDEGMDIEFSNNKKLRLIPAHYCHSSGTYSLYDPDAKILFSGDIGAALLPRSDGSFFVDHFDSHVQYIEKFHTRWMPSNTAKNEWICRVRNLQIKYLCPQHGSIYRDGQVHEFLDWFEKLDVGKTKAPPAGTTAGG